MSIFNYDFCRVIDSPAELHVDFLHSSDYGSINFYCKYILQSRYRQVRAGAGHRQNPLRSREIVIFSKKTP